jgi:hypothetical protein
VLCNLPRGEKVRIASTLGGRYFDLIYRLDELMPLLQRLQIEALIDESQAQRQRSKAMRMVLAICRMARALCIGCRHAVNESDVEEGGGSNARARDSVSRASSDEV